jgi:hypothetical protein
MRRIPKPKRNVMSLWLASARGAKFSSLRNPARNQSQFKIPSACLSERPAQKDGAHNRSFVIRLHRLEA